MKLLQVFYGRTAVLGVAAGLLLAGNVFAGPIGLSVFVQPVTSSPGDAGDTFELTVTNTGDQAVTVAGFGFGVSVSDADITLQDATITTLLNPYIFDGNSLFGPDILAGTDGVSLDAADIYSGDGGMILNPGDSFGLGEVSFDVAAGALPGIYTVALSTSDANTNFSDPDGGSIPIAAFNDGSIMIADNTTPEPATWLLLTGALAALKLRRMRSL